MSASVSFQSLSHHLKQNRRIIPPPAPRTKTSKLGKKYDACNLRIATMAISKASALIPRLPRRPPPFRANPMSNPNPGCRCLIIQSSSSRSLYSRPIFAPTPISHILSRSHCPLSSLALCTYSRRSFSKNSGKDLR